MTSQENIDDESSSTSTSSSTTSISSNSFKLPLSTSPIPVKNLLNPSDGAFKAGNEVTSEPPFGAKSGLFGSSGPRKVILDLRQKSWAIDPTDQKQNQEQTEDITWNGSIIGTYTSKYEFITSEYDEYGGKFWKFKWNTHSHLCRVRKLKDCTPIIADELKEIFGLYKLGTIRVIIGKNQWLIYRDRYTSEGQIIEDNLALSKFCRDRPKEISEELKSRVRACFTFRVVMGISGPHTHTKIHIRNGKGKGYYPVSYCDSQFISGKNLSLPKTVNKKWFYIDNKKSHKLADVVCEQLKINKRNNKKVLYRLKSQIQEVIIRIDNEFIYHESNIYSRLIDLVGRKFL